MRRGVGAAGLMREKRIEQHFDNAGETLQINRVAQVKEQLALFKSNLEEFARKHKNKINKNPEFRRQFQQMCAAIGVDPLVSNKGFWAELLGIGNFYYELGIQVVTVCLATRPRNGGLLELSECMRYLQKLRGRNAQAIGEDDVKRAIQKLQILGNGFKLISVGIKKVIVSVPVELNRDHNTVLDVAEETGWVNMSGLKERLRWDDHRIQTVMDVLLQESMAWIDDQSGDGERRYCFPALMNLTSITTADISEDTNSQLESTVATTDSDVTATAILFSRLTL
eukprot:GILK01004754.1.p1 GENE.GILK01004754.1~~GILK01004754.1.p1  ORF type:complete len:282 (+),score=38.72 GILK01004754.1:49-894(+)